jgi:hypothetical protein
MRNPPASRKRLGYICAMCLIAMSAQFTSARAQLLKDAPPKAQVMVLATYHFGNPNQDYVKTDVDNHLSEKRQKQIAEVVELLSKFKPTKIALEAVDGSSPVHANYAAYLKGEYSLKADEGDQLGFRLAQRLGHRRVYAVDHRMDMDFEGVVKAAQKSGDQTFLGMFQSVMTELQDFERRKAAMTVREILTELNDPQRIDKDRDAYLQIARIRDGEKSVGADVLAGWYQRNFRIFANLVRVVESPQDRVLAIFGASHAAILREMVRSSPDLRLVKAEGLLAKQ